LTDTTDLLKQLRAAVERGDALKKDGLPGFHPPGELGELGREHQDYFALSFFISRMRWPIVCIR